MSEVDFHTEAWRACIACWKIAKSVANRRIPWLYSPWFPPWDLIAFAVYIQKGQLGWMFSQMTNVKVKVSGPTDLALDWSKIIFLMIVNGKKNFLFSLLPLSLDQIKRTHVFFFPKVNPLQI